MICRFIASVVIIVYLSIGMTVYSHQVYACNSLLFIVQRCNKVSTEAAASDFNNV